MLVIILGQEFIQGHSRNSLICIILYNITQACRQEDCLNTGRPAVLSLQGCENLWMDWRSDIISLYLRNSQYALLEWEDMKDTVNAGRMKYSKFHRVRNNSIEILWYNTWFCFLLLQILLLGLHPSKVPWGWIWAPSLEVPRPSLVHNFFRKRTLLWSLQSCVHLQCLLQRKWEL